MLKKFLFCFLFCVAHLYSLTLVTCDGQLAKPLIELLALDGLYDSNDTLKEVVIKTQQHWIAVKQGHQQRERNDLKDNPQQEAQAEHVFALIKQLGLADEVPPTKIHYDYGVCLGAFLDGVRMRLHCLIQAWQQGIRFDTLVFLTGERYLRQEDSIEKLCNPTLSPMPFKPGWAFYNAIEYKTEYDMVKCVWDQIQIPDDMAQALEGKVIFVNAEKGSHARPSTKDTYRVWLRDYAPTPGSILAPSHPLVWIHQHYAGLSVLGKQFALDTTAPALIETFPAFVTLVHDTLAKCLYETYFTPTVCK